MINHQNWQLTKKYLDYRLNVDQISRASSEKERVHLRYLLEWLQETSFKDAPNFIPSLPQYLLTTRLDGSNGRLSAVYIKKILSTSRYFFTWLSDNEVGFRHIKQSWVKTIKAKRLFDMPKDRQAVSFEEILDIASAPAHALWERRARAGLVFLYLGGQRISAFVSSLVDVVDIHSRVINQDPALGVRTKNSKAAKTYLLNIPELLKVVQDWDDEVRPYKGLWFASLSPITGQITSSRWAGFHRHNLARRDFEKWLLSVGLPYRRPHEFRYGHIHYGLKRSKDVADFKAVSMNVMHSSMTITDTRYSVLRDAEVLERISSFVDHPEQLGDDDLLLKFKQFLEWSKQNK